MSFSKARIQRFNELTSQVPPPGAYDPKFEGPAKLKAKQAGKDSQIQLSQPAAPGSSQSSVVGAASVCSSRASNSSNAILVKPFRTPQVPKKRAVVKPLAAPQSCPRARAKLSYSANASKPASVQYEPQQELQDLKVELQNKDKTILEYERLLEELKLQASELEQQHQRDAQSMAKLQQQMHEQQRLELQSLREQLLRASQESERLRNRVEQLERQPSSELRVSRLLREQLGDILDSIDESNISSQPREDLSLEAQIQSFGREIKLAYEREIELSRDRFNEEREELEQQLEHREVLLEEARASLANLAQQFDSCKQTSRGLQDEKEQLERRLAESLESQRTEFETQQRQHREEVNYLHALIERAKTEYLQEVDKLEKSLEEEKRRVKDCADKMIENAEAVTRETLQACRAESEEKVRRIVAESEAKAREAATRASEQEEELAGLRLALEELRRAQDTQESFGQSLQAELDRAEAELVERKEELRGLKDQLRNESAEMVARRRRFELAAAENQASVMALTRRLAQSQQDNEALQARLDDSERELSQSRELLERLLQSGGELRERLESLARGLQAEQRELARLEAASLQRLGAAEIELHEDVRKLHELAGTRLAQELQRSARLEDQLGRVSEKLAEAQAMLLRLEQRDDEHELELSRRELQLGKLRQQLHDRERQIQRQQAQLAQVNEQLSSAQQSKSDETSPQSNNKQSESLSLVEQVAGQLHEKLKLEARRQIGTGKENQCSSPSKQLFSKSANVTPLSSPAAVKPLTPLRARND